MKRVTGFLVVLLMIVVITGCGGKPTVEEVVYDVEATVEVEATTEEVTKSKEVDEAEVMLDSQYPLMLTDKYDNEVVIEGVPETIISMSPELTEIIYALDSGDKIVGRSSYCNYPEAVLDITDFGTLFDLNIESIVAAQPDLIFLSSMASEELVQTLMDQELSVVTIDKDGTLEGTYAYMEIVAEILDKEMEAEVLIEEIKETISDVQTAIEGLETPTTYYVVYAGDGYDSTATGDTFIHGMLGLAGADNVAKEGTNWSYSVETLVEQDPYYVICGSGEETKTRIQGLEGYRELTAIQEGRLFQVNEDIFSRQGPRIGEAVKTIAKIIHPEVFN